MYVFKKVDSLIGDDNQTKGSQDSTIGDGSSDTNAANSQSGSNPYESSYQNPNSYYEANKNENQGNLDTGLNKSLNETRNNLKQGNADYNKNLDTAAADYKYNGSSDLENINDDKTWNRLNNVLNTNGGKAALNNVQSNTKYYNPDTSSVAAASTVEGLSNQLRNQYNSTAGGARLDAQLYRGSGQAGQAINQNLNQIDDFRNEKQNYLNNETNSLNNYTNQLDTYANQLKNDGSQYQNNYLTAAQTQAKAQQDLYNQNRATAAQQLSGAQNQFNVDNILRQAALAGANGRPIYSEKATPDFNNPTGWEFIQENNGGENSGASGYYRKDVTNDVLNDLINNAKNGIDFNSINKDYYLDPAKTLNENMYLDSRYNKLGQLLGTDQRAIEAAPTDLSVNANVAGYKDALQNYLNPQAANLQSQVNDLFGSGVNNNGTSNSAKVIDYLRSHPAAAAALGTNGINTITGGLGLDAAAGLGGWKKISSLF